MIDNALIGRVHRAVESLHSLVYFAPEADEEYVAIGLRPGRMGYFASRSAPMGAVGPEVVAATFYNFNPELVARHLPRAWTLAAPEQVVQARLRVADRSIRRLLGPESINSPELHEAAELARTASLACRAEGRPLYAGHAGLPWPEAPHLILWHAVTLLREHRGDGHVAVLLQAGLSGIESIVTHTATGRGFLVPAAKALRLWSDEQWAAAEESLQQRGLLDEHRRLTPAGHEMRTAVEQGTDQLDAAPWTSLGAEGTERLVTIGKALSSRIQEAGAFPTGVFAGR